MVNVGKCGLHCLKGNNMSQRLNPEVETLKTTLAMDTYLCNEITEVAKWLGLKKSTFMRNAIRTEVKRTKNKMVRAKK